MIKTRRLVIIDQNRETGEVLQAVLGGRETEVTSVRNWRQLEALSPTPQPTVLVMNAREPLPQHSQASSLQTLPRVVIGRVTTADTPESPSPAVWNRRFQVAELSVETPAAETSLTETRASECCVDELFEYPDLVNAIEKLWSLAG